MSQTVVSPHPVLRSQEEPNKVQWFCEGTFWVYCNPRRRTVVFIKAFSQFARFTEEVFRIHGKGKNYTDIMLVYQGTIENAKLGYDLPLYEVSDVKDLIRIVPNEH